MADEPERRLVGAIHAELERQHEDALLYVDEVASDGTCVVEGTVDLYLLARAILAETAGCTCAHILKDLDHRCRQHPEVSPKTQQEQAEFARGWDAKVAEGQK